MLLLETSLVDKSEDFPKSKPVCEHVGQSLTRRRYFLSLIFCLKVFKADIGPDGNARDELDVAITVDHPNLTKSLGVVKASSTKNSGGSIRAESEVAAAAAGGVAEGAGDGGGGDGIENLRWLVMERVVGRPLAEKPDFSSVLRCRWGSGRRFEPVLVLAVLLQVCF